MSKVSSDALSHGMQGESKVKQDYLHNFTVCPEIYISIVLIEYSVLHW